MMTDNPPSFPVVYAEILKRADPTIPEMYRFEHYCPSVCNRKIQGLRTRLFAGNFWQALLELEKYLGQVDRTIEITWEGVYESWPEDEELDDPVDYCLKAMEENMTYNDTLWAIKMQVQQTM